MPKILIMSDSHGLTDEITLIRERHHADYMIHCGDSELDSNTEELAGFLKVGGNCDFDNRFPNEQITTIDTLTIFVTHGHLFRVKWSFTKLAYRAEEKGANVICFGHTHIAGAEKVGNQLFINPGSIRQPRRRLEKTYALLTWNNSDDVRVNFYTVDGELVEELTYQTSM